MSGFPGVPGPDWMPLPLMVPVAQRQPGSPPPGGGGGVGGGLHSGLEDSQQMLQILQHHR